MRVRLVENGLDDLLLFGVQNLGQVLVELGLLLLKVCIMLVDRLPRIARAPTDEDMLEHAIRLNLVQRRLEQAFLIHTVVVVISQGSELLSLVNS